MKARALYSLGRIEDQRKNYVKAAEYYNQLNSEFDGISWAQFAKDRLIAFEAEGLLQ